MESDIVDLPDDLFIGKGLHKAAYVDPRDRTRCIKVCFHENDPDLERELKYRHWCHRESRMLPAYYGTVRTSRGTGYVYELIHDFDS